MKLSKTATSNPIRWLSENLDNTNAAVSVDKLIDRYSEKLNRITQERDDLKLERGIQSRKIGAAKAQNIDVSPHLIEMKAISKNINELEEKLANIMQVIVDEVTVDRAVEPTVAANVSSTPAYFNTFKEGDAGLTHTAHGLLTCVRVNGADDEALYTQYVNEQAAATAYHRSGFLKFIESQTGQSCELWLAKSESGEVCGVLPTTVISTRVFGTYMVSLPWVNYGGPLADSDEIGQQLLIAAQTRASELGCSHAEFRETHTRSGWVEQTHKVSMTLKLPDSRAAFEENLKSSLRAQSNKALRAGCIAHFGRAELINDFYKVFSHKMRSLGTPIHRKQFYYSLLELLGDDAHLCIIRRNSEPVAAGFMIAHGKTLEIPWASSVKQYDSLGVNMLLYRSVLGNAAESGYDYFDFGRSTFEGPTYRFKKQWGAQAQQLFWHVWSSTSEATSNVSPENKKYQLAIAVWKKLPVWVTTLVGPFLIRGLP